MDLPDRQLSGHIAAILEDRCVRAMNADEITFPALSALLEPQRSENNAGGLEEKCVSDVTSVDEMILPELQLPGNKVDVFREGFIHLAPRTHDVALTESHSNIHQLGNDLNQAVQAVWPKRHDVRYLQVYVLLLSWVDDDLGVLREIKGLQRVFKEMYKFQVQEYQIPSSKPDKALKRRVSDFLDIDAKENLLIIYYGGHARRALQSNEASLWFANRDNPSIAIPSGGIQSMLEEADADVLLLLDCCHSAAVPTTDCQQRIGGVVEVIAACGYETIAAEVDQHSFTKALTDILAMASKGLPFSIGELHSRVLSRLKCWTPQLATDGEGNYIENAEGRLLYERQPRRTPIYSILCETRPRRSIVLGSLLDTSSSSSSDYNQETPSIKSSSTTSPPLSDSDDECKCSTGTSFPTAAGCGDRDPQVLLAIRLDSDIFDLEAWIEWVRNAPPEAKDIRIEGTYDSFSTLVLLRMPVTIWNLLPENSAYSFVGFVTSGNKFLDVQHDAAVPPNPVQFGRAPPLAQFTHDSRDQGTARLERHRSFKAAGDEGFQSYGKAPKALDQGLKGSFESPVKTSHLQATHVSSRPSTSARENTAIPTVPLAAPAEFSVKGRPITPDSDSGFEITMALVEQLSLTQNSGFSISPNNGNELLNDSATIPDAKAGVEVDSGLSINFSDIEDSDTESIDSAVTNYRWENGRRYHGFKDGAYWAPNDDQQNESLDISHHKFLMLLDGKLHLAPLPKDIERALDVGTGTGIWAIDFANQYPDAIVHGTDLSPIQPDFVPSNCEFFIDDAQDEWTYPPNHLDFVHIRGLFGSISDWPALYKQAYKHLKPGGYIEHIEISIDVKSDDGTIKPDNPLVTLSDFFTTAGRITGQTFRISDYMKQDIQDAGFVGVVEKVYTAPIGGWSKDPKLKWLGTLALLAFDAGLDGYALATFTRVMGWSPDAVYVFLTQVRAAAQNRRIHSFHDIKVVYAQKPFEAKLAQRRQ